MNAGELDRRIVVEQYTTTRDSWNHPTQTWTTLATVWANKHVKRSNERTEMEQTVNVNLHTFRIRYRADVDTTMRIAHDGRYYYIVGTKELGRKEGLELTTEQREQ